MQGAVEMAVWKGQMYEWSVSGLAFFAFSGPAVQCWSVCFRGFDVFGDLIAMCALVQIAFCQLQCDPCRLR